MKQQIIELKKKLLLVELPEGLKPIVVNNIKFFGYSTLICENIKEQDLDHINLIKGSDCKLIGKLTDITEEQFRQWVDKFHDGYYRDYKEKISFSPDADTDIFFLSAEESFLSALEAEGICFENKMLEPGSAPIYTHSEKYIEDYKKACRKVWNRNNTYVFEIL